ncbi:phosphatidylserine/phosphatidylglycerophosphate/cardiolipin synthase [Desulfosporosinus acidiphilus SJ4]|uniref:Cardiolipin synthase n=1 Tax=Desulfosporosinus acidiphilus (strain DSM 22704 / JCM 16185 / SJ4) TaxID=646529 RepID=I4D6Z5_DESAJ|nr:cardiolipin synthase [Desulfosporosinus acidiphilus]AFM41569.1 phosphatidylserine/phosphatidylglycerophosphate/cardiolipin synthase [Desulfosporosinus acidiphilus SJ4]
MYWLILLLFVQIVLFGSVILLENKDPGKTVTWLFILSLLPVLGFLLYVLFAQRQRNQLFKKKTLISKRLPYNSDQQETLLEQECPMLYQERSIDPKILKLLYNSGYAPPSVHNRVVVLVNGGEKFKALLQALENASHHIHLSYYIFKDDEIGADILKILSRKSSEGVEVRVLLDGVGSLSIAGNFMGTMRKMGIQAHWYFPVRFPFLTPRLNLRYHRKIVIVDGSVGFMGGLNIGDEYLSRNPKLGFWRDTHIKLLGESVHTLQTIFLNDWYSVSEQEIKGEIYFPKVDIPDILPIQIGVGGPDTTRSSILQGFFVALTMAKKNIKIETPYFIPDESLMMALKTAALSGIDVQIIIQGVPEHKVTYWAMNSYLEELLKAGVQIYQYMKGILHAKILLIDDNLASVGSANMDVRSFVLDFEISAFIYDSNITMILKENFEQDLKESRSINLETFQTRPYYERLKESLARLFSPLL